MQGSEFDEGEFFRAIAASGARALLIGRRALIALGMPVLTADYDFWLHIDDIAAFNAAVGPSASFRPARRTRRALVGATCSRTTSRWTCSSRAPSRRWTACGSLRRRLVAPARPRGRRGPPVAVPSMDDLILTKRFGGRPKDVEDIRLLEALRGEEP